MRFLILLLTLFISLGALAQFKGQKRFGVAYFGEIITHPGLSLSYENDIHFFGEQIMDDLRIPKSRTLFYSVELGGFHHKRAMNAGFAQLRLGFRKRGVKSRTWSVDIGNGYLLGSIPNTFQVLDGSVSKTSSLHHYTIHSINVSYGKASRWLPGLDWFMAPSFYIKRPAFPNYTAHFALRIGLKKVIS